MNNPPTSLVGFGTSMGQFFCRLSMNDPPTLLVGFGRSIRWRFCEADYERSTNFVGGNTLIIDAFITPLLQAPIPSFNHTPAILKSMLPNFRQCSSDVSCEHRKDCDRHSATRQLPF